MTRGFDLAVGDELPPNAWIGSIKPVKTSTLNPTLKRHQPVIHNALASL